MPRRNLEEYELTVTHSLSLEASKDILSPTPQHPPGLLFTYVMKFF